MTRNRSENQSRRPRRALSGLALIATLVTAGAAVAWAPPPARPISEDIYSGRWYEIARTPNNMQKDCQAPTSDFTSWSGGEFLFTETCHRGTVDGPLKVVRARARLLRPGDNTRFRVSFFGGLVRQEYWILDHADDNSWLILATPGGNFVWLLARRPSLPGASLAAATSRAASLGYAPSRLIYPAQATG